MLSAMPSRRQSSAIEVSPRRPSSTMRIFSSAAWCSGLPAGCCGQAFRTTLKWSWILSHLRSLRATMRQKSFVAQAVSFVSQVLKRDSINLRLRVGLRKDRTIIIIVVIIRLWRRRNWQCQC
jgi:hypothetical protein